jgi:hypothetical protein
MPELEMSLEHRKRAVTVLRDIEKHVLDDAIELIASVGLGNPLMHTTVLFEMQGDQHKVALFLRGLLGRHVVLVVTRLHALKHEGKTGDTASIDSYLHYAEAEALLSDKEAAAFRSKRQAIILKLETAGIKFSELISFRHAELAHSLHCAIFDYMGFCIRHVRAGSRNRKVCFRNGEVG